MNKHFAAFGQTATARSTNRASNIVNTVTAKQFFIEDNVNGYLTKERFISYGQSLTDSEAEHLEDLFKFTSQGCSFNNVIKPKFDRINGEEMLWFKVKLTRATINLRIPNLDGLLRLLTEYQLGKTQINFSLDELKAECQSMTEEQN
ncbi:hypothetical protein [Pedobacter miscanthi]|uniref:Uncharacterized protein n=1 Tax=Pedobacter miscanthi TaxID=2259170 RepID=A0A366KW26_9SPHI|nr:hypothetical protein [Pedobacter miscanthi]RBQ05841.1 hypothetical protein DRW42_15190 [Pedobacter miscanthi]